MKIVFNKPVEKPATVFQNGHIYRKLDGSLPLFLCSCGELIELPVCSRQFNIMQTGSKPESFIDVTDQFELKQVN